MESKELFENTSLLLNLILKELKKEEMNQPIHCNQNKAISIFSYHASKNKRHQTLMYAYFVLIMEHNSVRAKTILDTLLKA